MKNEYCCVPILAHGETIGLLHLEFGSEGKRPHTIWAQAEGSNVVLGPNCQDEACPSPYGWESYLAASYNHGASIVTVFGTFEGETGAFTSALDSQAIAAYRKFLTGQR